MTHAFATAAIHGNSPRTDGTGALNTPVYYSATYTFASAEQGIARFAGKEPGMIYSRITNPTVRELEHRLALLEGTEAGLVFSSGVGALGALVLSLARVGAQVLTDLTLYGCTQSMVHRILPRLGMTTVAVDFTDPLAVQAALTDRTVLVLCETPTNPNMRILDIERLSSIVHGHSLALFAVDSTYATPFLQQPAALGADVVLHSLTKYINGHGDVVGGALLGPAELLDDIRMQGLKEITGACMSPMDAYLVLRGLKTLELRMLRHCASACAIAGFLERHGEVEDVIYPGLPSHAQFELASRQMKLPGGIVALRVRGRVTRAHEFMNRLRLIGRAVSFGDAESLVQLPASMTHAGMDDVERARHLLDDRLIRLSVGLEDVRDLIDDLERALDAT